RDRHAALRLLRLLRRRLPRRGHHHEQQLRHGLLQPRPDDRRQGGPDEALYLRRGAARLPAALPRGGSGAGEDAPRGFLAGRSGSPGARGPGGPEGRRSHRGDCGAGRSLRAVRGWHDGASRAAVLIGRPAASSSSSAGNTPPRSAVALRWSGIPPRATWQRTVHQPAIPATPAILAGPALPPLPPPP